MTWVPGNYNGTCYRNSCDQSTALFLAFVVQYFGKSIDELLTEKINRQNDDKEDYDFIIVGAGAAGCVVANRLSEILDWKVLLLEAGGEEPYATQVPGLISFFPNSNIDYAYRTNDTPPSSYIRGKVMGGSSSINAMWYVRGSKEDYNSWARNGNDGWRWEEVLPYFKRSEDARDPELLEKYPQYHGTGGYLSVEKLPVEDRSVEKLITAFKEFGSTENDYNSGDQIGVSRVQHTNTRGSRMSSNAAFIRPIRGRRSNLVIKTNATATKIIINEESKRATGVEYRVISENGTTTIKKAYAKKEVIVSAGVIDSPKLLLLSGIGPTKDLNYLNITVIQDLPVGLNFHDHSAIYMPMVSTNQTTSSIGIGSRRNDLINWLTTHEGRWSMNRFLGFTAFYQTSFENQRNTADIQYVGLNISADLSGLGPYFDNFHIITVLITPKSRGYIKLNQTDPHGKPIIFVNTLGDSQDEKTLIEALKFTRKIVNSKALKDAGYTRSTVLAEACKNFKLDSDDYLECLVKNRVNVSPFLHGAGTCKMGPSNDDSAVVDPQLKVRGIKGLRVIDTSIMPNVTRGNTMAPAIMIGEKGSDLIKKDWQ